MAEIMVGVDHWQCVCVCVRVRVRVGGWVGVRVRGWSWLAEVEWSVAWEHDQYSDEEHALTHCCLSLDPAADWSVWMREAWRRRVGATACSERMCCW